MAQVTKMVFLRPSALLSGSVNQQPMTAQQLKETSDNERLVSEEPTYRYGAELTRPMSTESCTNQSVKL
jgi:hypothetical protein